MAIVHRFRDHEVHEGVDDSAPVISDEVAFRDALTHTFTHEWSLGNADPAFWTDNALGIPCRYDRHPFRGPIFSLPISYHNLSWVVRWVFCSPHCMKKFASVSREVPMRVFTLISLMMRMVYKWDGDVVPASDIDLILNPLDKEWFGQIEKWRAIPRQHVQIRLVHPMVIPFRMEKQNVVSHVMRTHPGYADLRKWNTVLVEPGPLPEEVVDLDDVEKRKAEGDAGKAKKKRAAESDEDEDDDDEDAPKKRKSKAPKAGEKKRRVAFADDQAFE